MTPNVIDLIQASRAAADTLVSALSKIDGEFNFSDESADGWMVLERQLEALAAFGDVPAADGSTWTAPTLPDDLRADIAEAVQRRLDTPRGRLI